MLFKFAFVINLLSLTYAQQTFESRGDHYHAKVVIHRDHPPTYNQIQAVPQKAPWKQGDRITKQEVIQNMAKALLHRKKSPSERAEERRKKNEEALQEYTLIQARLTRLQKEAEEGHIPLPQPEHKPPQSQPQYPPRENQLQDLWHSDSARRWRFQRSPYG